MLKNLSIWAIDQLHMMKTVGSATVFPLWGALVPWSPGTQADYLNFQCSKLAEKKNLRINLWFITTFVFFSILKSQVCIGTWSQSHLVDRRHIMASGGQNEMEKNIKEKTLGPEQLLFSIKFWNIDWPYATHLQLCYCLWILLHIELVNMYCIIHGQIAKLIVFKEEAS